MVGFGRLFVALLLLGSFALCTDGRLSTAHSSQKTAVSRVRVSLQPCEVPNLDGGGQCGTFEVYENRLAKTGRKISLNIVVVPALSATHDADPVFWLHGGPGAAATQVAGAAKGGFLEGLRQTHDLIFVDQRGTGKSNPLDCNVGDDPTDLEAYFGKLFRLAQVRACREKLEASADLKLYTTSIAMDDLDEVRDALGYTKIDIVAASYGTIAAQVYVRQHPDRVRAVFLAGVATPGIKQPLPFARGAQEALNLLFVDCAADPACHHSFPDLKKEFSAVLRRFEQAPQEVRMIDPVSKQKRNVKLERENYVERLRLLLYTTTFARFVPLVVHRAFEGDFIPFETISIAYNPGSLLSRGMYLTVTCSEGIPFITSEEIVEQSRGTFVGETRVRSHQAACKEWPRGDVSRDFIDPIKSPLPILMFSGGVDGSTPPWLGEAAVKFLTNGKQVQARYYGHQLDSPCMWAILQKFVERASTAGLDVSCAAKIRRPPFAIQIPNEFSLQ
jgi:pimeloyl-ACP methyl ester carboxylesterase